MTRLKSILIVLVAFLWMAGFAVGDTLVMKDGTKLVGSVMKSGDRYWIEPDNGGKAHFVDSSDVKDWIKGTTAAATPAAGSGSSGTSTSSTPVTSASTANSAQFNVARAKADSLIYPADVIKVWKDFLAAKPVPADLDKKAAEQLVADMTTLMESGSERVSGKWVSGVERKKLAADARDVFKEAVDLLEADKTIQAIPKLQEVLKIYPNHYNANSYMCYISYAQDNTSDAQKYADMCLRLRPSAIDALNNAAVLLAKKNQMDQAVAKFYEAVQIEDDEILAYNLSKAVTADPNKNSAAMQSAVPAAKLLASKYEIPNGTAAQWASAKYLMHPPVAPQRASQGMLVSGSGFVLNNDGYVITNRHVVSKMTSFLIITADGKSLPADLIKIDEDRDLALLKIKKLDPAIALTPVIISNTNYPTQGQQCYALGYPLMDVIGVSLKITQGIITGKPPDASNGVDVLTDAKVNPGNSGGPLLDVHGQVIGIVTMKTLSDTMEDSYGMAISAGTIKKFLADNKVTPAAGDAGGNLAPEDVVKKVRAGAVCILATDGGNVAVAAAALGAGGGGGTPAPRESAPKPRQTTTAPADANHVSLLALVDPKADAISGNWSIDQETKALISDDKGKGDSLIEFPYAPGAEYDFRVTFVRDTGTANLVVVLVGGGKQFLFNMDTAGTAGFAKVSGAIFSNNRSTHHNLPILRNGAEHTLLFSVRKDGADVWLDGALISSIQTDYQEMSMNNVVVPHRNDTLAFFETGPQKVHILAAEVTEISGKGTVTRK